MRTFVRPLVVILVARIPNRLRDLQKSDLIPNVLGRKQEIYDLQVRFVKFKNIRLCILHVREDFVEHVEPQLVNGALVAIRGFVLLKKSPILSTLIKIAERKRTSDEIADKTKIRKCPFHEEF